MAKVCNETAKPSPLDRSDKVLLVIRFVLLFAVFVILLTSLTFEPTGSARWQDPPTDSRGARDRPIGR